MRQRDHGRAPTEAPWDADFVLDSEFRFVSTARIPALSADVPTGRAIWDLLGGESEFRERWEQVLKTGEELAERVFFDGSLFEILVEPFGRFLRVRYRLLMRAETKTLDDLLGSVRAISEALSAPFGTPDSARG